MDNIQKILIKLGRRDLAQQYFEKISKSYPGRAWKGGLNKLDNYIEHLYEYMNQADKNLKDKVFHAYYRHYNDGDFKSLPVKRLKLSQGDIYKYQQFMDFSREAKKRNEKQYQEVLEKALEAAIKHFLTKYKGVLSRQKVYYKEYKDIIDYIIKGDYREPYWIEKLTKQTDNKEIASIAKKLEKQVETWRKEWSEKMKNLDYGSDERKKMEKKRDKDRPELNKQDINKLKNLMKEELLKKQQLLKLEDMV